MAVRAHQKKTRKELLDSTLRGLRTLTDVLAEDKTQEN